MSGDLAAESQIDADALQAHVLQVARRRAGSALDDAALSRNRTIFGWGFVRPSVWLARDALGRVAAQLFDAGAVDLDAAVYAGRLWPPFDALLLRTRPSRRPSGVVPSDELAKDTFHYGDKWLNGVADAEKRLAREHEDMIVIGEHTELRHLETDGPGERRAQGARGGRRIGAVSRRRNVRDR